MHRPCRLGVPGRSSSCTVGRPPLGLSALQPLGTGGGDAGDRYALHIDTGSGWGQVGCVPEALATVGGWAGGRWRGRVSFFGVLKVGVLPGCSDANPSVTGGVGVVI